MVELIKYYIGRTPLLKMWSKGKVSIYAKMENYNLSGSIKDRTAYYMLTNAMDSGKLRKGSEIVESSSGNTGISLAMFGAMFGFKVNIILPKNASIERKEIIKRYGGKVIEVESAEWRQGAIELAKELSREKGMVFLNQYSNPNNWIAHYETTGQEIVQQIVGEINYFIAGIGTGGTLIGAGQKIKLRHPEAKIIGVQPKLGDRIEGLKNMDEDKSEIIKKNENIIDEVIDVGSKEAIANTYKIGKTGNLVGWSSGAVFKVALDIAKKIDKGNIVIIFPDSGNRYLCKNAT